MLIVISVFAWPAIILQINALAKQCAPVTLYHRIIKNELNLTPFTFLKRHYREQSLFSLKGWQWQL